MFLNYQLEQLSVTVIRKKVAVVSSLDCTEVLRVLRSPLAKSRIIASLDITSAT